MSVLGLQADNTKAYRSANKARYEASVRGRGYAAMSATISVT